MDCVCRYFSSPLSSEDRNAFFYKCHFSKGLGVSFSLFFLSKYTTFIYVPRGTHTRVTTQIFSNTCLVMESPHVPSGSWHPWKRTLIKCQVSVYRKKSVSGASKRVVVLLALVSVLSSEAGSPVLCAMQSPRPGFSSQLPLYDLASHRASLSPLTWTLHSPFAKVNTRGRGRRNSTEVGHLS